MAELTFENLNFSFLIDQQKNVAYLQEWDNGNWSDAEQHSLPVDLAHFPTHSRLARAIRELRDEALALALSNTPMAPAPTFVARVRDCFKSLQQGSRLLAARLVA